MKIKKKNKKKQKTKKKNNNNNNKTKVNLRETIDKLMARVAKAKNAQINLNRTMMVKNGED